MVKRFVQLGSIAAVALFLAAPARAATVIDFQTNGAGMGGWLTWDGSNLTGSNIPIGVVTVTQAPTNNGTFSVYGSATGSGSHGPGGGNMFGDLDFATGPGSFITLAGCIPGLSVGVFNPVTGTCSTSAVLLSGSITQFDNSHATNGLISASGIDTKNASLLAAIGLPATTPFAFFGFSLATNALGPDRGSSAISTDIRNTAVPEPASLMLLGTGLLALCRIRRRTA